MRFPIIQKQELLNLFPEAAKVLSQFEAFKDSTLQSLISANNYNEKIPTHFLGLSGKNTQQIRQELVQSANEINAKKFHQT